MGHSHSVYDTDTHFSINPVTRAIKNESSRKVVLIQYDHNSERFSFDLPRYIEGHDMSLCNKVEVHFLNVAQNKETKSGVYTVDDLQIAPDDSEVVVCSWLISRNATQLAGSLHFLIKYSCVAGEIIEYAWHTDVFKGITVSNGINAGESLETEYLDVIEQWKAQTIQSITADVNAGVTKWQETEAGVLRGLLYNETAKTNAALAVERSRIDQFVSLPSGSTSGDAELQDVRIGISGNPYSAAGSAVREQIGNILKNIDEICSGENVNVFWRYANDSNKGTVYKWDTGELISTSGNYSHSGLIPVRPGQTVTVYEPEPNGICITMMGAYFDVDGNLVRGMGYHPDYSSGEPTLITVPDGVFYIAVNYHLDLAGETAVIPRVELPWTVPEGDQKVWCCVGDSLTEANSRAEKHYFDYVAEELSLSVLNYGVSGTGYKNCSFANRIAGITEKFDVMTIFGSFNDLDAEWELGDPTNTDTTTICGCMNAAIEAFFSKYPTKKLGIITPTPWKKGIEYFGKASTAENMEAYVDALLNVAKTHRLPCLDLYHGSGLNPDNAAVLTAYFNENGTQDVGAHPNSEGHKFFSSAVREFVKSLL